MDDPLLVDLCKKYNKTGAQVLLRWGLQKVGCYTKLVVANAKTRTTGLRHPPQVSHPLSYTGELSDLRFCIVRRRYEDTRNRQIRAMCMGPHEERLRCRMAEISWTTAEANDLWTLHTVQTTLCRTKILRHCSFHTKW